MIFRRRIERSKTRPQPMIMGSAVGKVRVALTEQVADLLAERIIVGEFPEESLLPSERKLLESLKVSRTVVREAIKALESRGLVRIERGRGKVIQEPQLGPVTDVLKMLIRRRSHLMGDLLELRRVLEVHMVIRAAERCTEPNLKNMERFLEELGGNPSAQKSLVGAEIDFHLEIARATQNPLLLVLLEPLSGLLHESCLTSDHGPRMVRLRARQHEEILKCIQNRDGEGARIAMSRHLDDTERDLKDRSVSPRTKLEALDCRK